MRLGTFGSLLVARGGQDAHQSFVHKILLCRRSVRQLLVEHDLATRCRKLAVVNPLRSILSSPLRISRERLMRRRFPDIRIVQLVVVWIDRRGRPGIALLERLVKAAHVVVGLLGGWIEWDVVLFQPIEELHLLQHWKLRVVSGWSCKRGPLGQRLHLSTRNFCSDNRDQLTALAGKVLHLLVVELSQAVPT